MLDLKSNILEIKKCRAKIIEHLSKKDGNIDLISKFKSGEISKEEYDSFEGEVKKNRDRLIKSARDFLENNPNEKEGSDGCYNAMQECIYNIFLENYIEEHGWSASRAKEHIDYERARHQENKRIMEACTPVCTCHESMEQSI